MNLGAGRIVYQDLTRIDAAIEDGSFFANEELRSACAAVSNTGGTLHLLGLLSPGGVHSHEDHILAMIEMARREKVADVAVHAFLDGRDMPPRSAAPSLAKLYRVSRIAGRPAAGRGLASAPFLASLSRPGACGRPRTESPRRFAAQPPLSRARAMRC